MSREWVGLLLYGILLLYAAEDLTRHRISNGNILAGLAAGMIFGAGSFEQILVRLVEIVLLFMFGMLGLLSMGDLKIWMVLTSFTGIYKSTVIIFWASILLILYAELEKPDHVHAAFRHMYLTWKVPARLPYLSTGYPFAPFILAGCMGYYLITQI